MMIINSTETLYNIITNRCDKQLHHWTFNEGIDFVLVWRPWKCCTVVWVVFTPLSICMVTEIPGTDILYPFFQLFLCHLLITVLVNFIIEEPVNNNNNNKMSLSLSNYKPWDFETLYYEQHALDWPQCLVLWLLAPKVKVKVLRTALQYNMKCTTCTQWLAVASLYYNIEPKQKINEKY